MKIASIDVLKKVGNSGTVKKKKGIAKKGSNSIISFIRDFIITKSNYGWLIQVDSC